MNTQPDMERFVATNEAGFSSKNIGSKNNLRIQPQTELKLILSPEDNAREGYVQQKDRQQTQPNIQKRNSIEFQIQQQPQKSEKTVNVSMRNTNANSNTSFQSHRKFKIQSATTRNSEKNITPAQQKNQNIASKRPQSAVENHNLNFFSNRNTQHNIAEGIRFHPQSAKASKAKIFEENIFFMHKKGVIQSPNKSSRIYSGKQNFKNYTETDDNSGQKNTHQNASNIQNRFSMYKQQQNNVSQLMKTIMKYNPQQEKQRNSKNYFTNLRRMSQFNSSFFVDYDKDKKNQEGESDSHSEKLLTEYIHLFQQHIEQENSSSKKAVFEGMLREFLSFMFPQNEQQSYKNKYFQLLSSTTQQIANMKQKLEEQNEKLSGYCQENTDLNQKCQQYHQLIDNNDENYKNMEKKVEQCTSLSEQLEMVNSMLRDKSQELEDEIMRLKGSEREKKAIIDSLQQQVKKAENDSEVHSQQLEQLQRSIEVKKEEVNRELKSANQLLEQQIKSALKEKEINNEIVRSQQRELIQIMIQNNLFELLESKQNSNSFQRIIGLYKHEIAEQKQKLKRNFTHSSSQMFVEEF